MSCDPKCWTLAEHFLSDWEPERVTEKDVGALAREIQNAVEAWLADNNYEK